MEPGEVGTEWWSGAGLERTGVRIYELALAPAHFGRERF
ncbi:MAG: hypothetical protein QOE88_1511 [Verrucomicrobiota bacterium]|jgi:hypothetical protein|nr:hypothetical protein [Verrucomicrobiota bacterium]MEA3163693.1 hypothetical protein [Verrucomicrobiota bacterium]